MHWSEVNFSANYGTYLDTYFEIIVFYTPKIKYAKNCFDELVNGFYKTLYAAF